MHGGLNAVKVFRRGEKPELLATIPTGDLPHGIWPSGDGTRVYIGLENGDAVQAIDTLTNKINCNHSSRPTSASARLCP